MIVRTAIAFLLFLLLILNTSAQSSAVPHWILNEKFLRACDVGDIDEVKKLLKAGVSPNARDIFGQPALLRTLRPGPVKSSENIEPILRLLLDSGADISATNDFGSTALFFLDKPDPLLKLPNLEYHLLVARGLDPLKKDRFGLDYLRRDDYEDSGKMPLAEAGWRFLIEGRAALQKDFYNGLGRYSNSATMPMAVAYYGEAWQRRFGFGFQADVDDKGETHLFYMASRSRFHQFELSNIDLKVANIVSKTGETALIRAARFDNDFLLVRLLAAKVNAEVRDNTGRNALDYAVEYDNYLTTMTLLLALDPTRARPDGSSPMFQAIEAGNTRALAAMINARRMIPKLEKAAKGQSESYDAKMVKAFKKIDFNSRDADGRTPLIAAVDKEDPQSVEAILLVKPKLNTKDKAGRTALSIAKKKGNAAILKLLAAR